MKLTFKITLIFLLPLFIMGCTSTQLSTAFKTVNDSLDEEQALSSADVIAGLKEALVIGVEKSTSTTSKLDGYFKNPEIKIPFPPEIQEVEKKLRQLGMNEPVDDFTLSINRAAEKAAGEAKILFIDAIKEMSIEDAWGILKGEQNAATEYLRRTTSAKLELRFKPIIDESLEAVNATKYYKDVTKLYNQIPFVTKVETDLSKYVMTEALDGLFIMLAKEEALIREDPLARTTDLLQRVFNEQ